MTPLLPPAEMLYSSDSSNQSNFSVVTRSPAFFGSTQAKVPSTTFHPGATSFRLYVRHPSVVLPSKSSFHPVVFSESVSPLEASSAQVFISTLHIKVVIKLANAILAISFMVLLLRLSRLARQESV